MTKRVLIQVYDHDTLSFDDKVSQITLNLDQIRFHPFAGRYFTLYGAPHNMKSGFMNKGVKAMMNDPSKGSYFRGQILLSAKMLTQKETASMNLPDHVQTKRAKHLQESRHESKIVPYVFRAFMCSGTFDVLVDDLVFHSLTHSHQSGTEIPKIRHITGVAKVALKISVGAFSIMSEYKPSKKGFVQWMEIKEWKREEDDYQGIDTEICFPEDPTQVPDICVYLLAGNDPICYARIPAVEFIKRRNGGNRTGSI